MQTIVDIFLVFGMLRQASFDDPGLPFLQVSIADPRQVHDRFQRFSEFIIFDACSNGFSDRIQLFDNVPLQIVHGIFMQRRYLSLAMFVHQHQCPIDKISEDTGQFTVIGFLESLPGEFAVLRLRRNGRQIITQTVHQLAASVIFFDEVVDIVLHVQLPVAAGAHFIPLQVHELVGGDIVRQDISRAASASREK